MKIKDGVNIVRLTFLGLIAIAIAGCAVEPSGIESGLFVDAPVEGLMYESGSLVGRTDAEGRFYYETGKDVTFSIEGIVIASIQPKDFVAPFDLVSSTAFVSDAEVTNISRFMQSLDEDGDPDNGIYISKTDRDRFYDNFSSLSFLSFTGTGFDAITGFFEGKLRSPVAAQTHLLASLAKYDRLSIDLINLGDGFTAGMQSSKVDFKNMSGTADFNLHQSTQAYGYPNILAGQIRSVLGDNLTWSSPQLEMDAFRNKSSILGEVIPYNLAVPGATAQSFINYTTGKGNEIADLLLLPIFTNLSGSPPPGTQLDAAKLLASQTGHERRLKIFTLWIGMNDVLGAITAGGGTQLTVADIDNFLSDSADGHDLTSVKANISTIVTELSAVKDSYLFIATLPDVTKTGALYYKDDIESLAQFDNVSAAAMEYFDNVTGTEIVALGSYAFAHYSDISGFGISRHLNYSSENALNNAISGLDPDWTLTKAELLLIRNRVDEINTYIQQTFADPVAYPSVFVVDIYNMFEEISTDSIQIGETDTVQRRFGGGFFSLDGIYPSNTGYALIAKEFIERIASPFAFSTYTSYVNQMGINTDNGIGINIDPEAIDLEGIWSSDPYRDYDGDGFPAGPGDVILSDYTTISSIDPSLDFMRDCSDAYVSFLPEAISGIACDGL